MKWTATLVPFVVCAVAVVILGAPAVAGAADVQGTLVRVDPVTKVIVLDDGRTLTMTDRTMIFVNGQPTAVTRVIPGTLILVRDAEPRAGASDALTMTVQAPQPTATVQIPQTKVIVQQPAPRIVVNQMPPQVVVAPAPAPQVSLSGSSGTEGAALPRAAQAPATTAMHEARVTSTPGALTMTVQAPQPTATVQIPQTKVIVQQPAPRIVVNQMPPQVVVAPAPAPHVVVERRAAAEPAASPALRVTPSVAASRAPARAVTTTRAYRDPAGTRDIWCAGDWDPGRGTNFGICSSRP